jgi:hypothetical protein
MPREWLVQFDGGSSEQTLEVLRDVPSARPIPAFYPMGSPSRKWGDEDTPGGPRARFVGSWCVKRVQVPPGGSGHASAWPAQPEPAWGVRPAFGHQAARRRRAQPREAQGRCVIKGLPVSPNGDGAEPLNVWPMGTRELLVSARGNRERVHPDALAETMPGGSLDIRQQAGGLPPSDVTVRVQRITNSGRTVGAGSRSWG